MGTLQLMGVGVRRGIEFRWICPKEGDYLIVILNQVLKIY